MVDDTSLLLLEQKYRNNNPGNIKIGTYGGQTWDGVSNYKGSINPELVFRKYESKAHGLADIITISWPAIANSTSTSTALSYVLKFLNIEEPLKFFAQFQNSISSSK